MTQACIGVYNQTRFVGFHYIDLVVQPDFIIYYFLIYLLQDIACFEGYIAPLWKQFVLYPWNAIRWSGLPECSMVAKD